MQLVPQVGQVEALALLQFFREFLGLVLADFLFDLFNQRQHVAHAENTRRHAIGMECLECIDLFADTHEANGLAGDFANGQRNAALGIAIRFGQHDAGQRQTLLEYARRVHCILSGHAINHKQGLVRLCRVMHGNDFLHHVLVNVQTARCIDDNNVSVGSTRLVERARHYSYRSFARVTLTVQCTNFAGEGLQLKNGRRPVHIDANQHDFFLVVID